MDQIFVVCYNKDRPIKLKPTKLNTNPAHMEVIVQQTPYNTTYALPSATASDSEISNSNANATPMGYNGQGVMLPPRAHTMRTMAKTIPLNDFGLPSFFYRADLVPAHVEDAPIDEQGEFLDAATIELDYTQGFPMLPDGEPFWGILPGEPIEAHQAFRTYIGMVKNDGEFASPVRQLHVLKLQTGISTATLIAWLHTYFWTTRAQAFDTFEAVSQKRLKAYRLKSAENKHYLLAEGMIDQSIEYLQRAFADPEAAGLKPADAIRLLEKMAALQRVSCGASPTGPGPVGGKGDPNVESDTTPVEVIFRNIAQRSGQITEAQRGNDAQDVAQHLYSNPDALQNAQELIIRMNASKNPRTLNAHAFTTSSEEDY